MEERAAAGARCRELPGPLRAAAVPCFRISVHQDDILPGALRLIQELRPHWKPEQVRTKVPQRECRTSIRSSFRASAPGGAAAAQEG